MKLWEFRETNLGFYQYLAAPCIVSVCYEKKGTLGTNMNTMNTINTINTVNTMNTMNTMKTVLPMWNIEIVIQTVKIDRATTVKIDRL